MHVIAAGSFLLQPPIGIGGIGWMLDRSFKSSTTILFAPLSVCITDSLDGGCVVGMLSEVGMFGAGGGGFRLLSQGIQSDISK